MGKIENINQTVEELQEKLRKLKSKQVFFKEIYTKEKYDAFLAEIDSLEEEINELEKLKQSMDKYSDQYEYERIMLMTDEEVAEDLEKKHKELLEEIKHKNSNIRLEIDHRKGEINTINDEIKSLEDQINSISEKFENPDMSEEEMHSLIQEGKKLTNTITKLSSKKDKLQKEIDELNTTFKDENIDKMTPQEYKRTLLEKLEKYSTEKIQKPEGYYKLVYECLNNGMTIDEFVEKQNEVYDNIQRKDLLLSQKPFKTGKWDSDNCIADLSNGTGEGSIYIPYSELRQANLAKLLSYLTTNNDRKSRCFSNNTRIEQIIKILRNGEDYNYGRQTFKGLNKLKEEYEEELEKIDHNIDNWKKLKRLREIVKENDKDYKKIIEYIEKNYTEMSYTIEQYYNRIKQLEADNRELETKQAEIHELVSKTSIFGRNKREKQLAILRSDVAKLKERIEKCELEVGLYKPTNISLRSMVLIDKYSPGQAFYDLAEKDVDALRSLIKESLKAVTEDIESLDKIEKIVKESDLKAKEECVRQLLGEDVELTEEEIDAMYHRIAMEKIDENKKQNLERQYKNMIEEEFIISERERAKKDYEEKKKQITAEDLVEEIKEDYVEPEEDKTEENNQNPEFPNRKRRPLI